MICIISQYRNHNRFWCIQFNQIAFTDLITSMNVRITNQFAVPLHNDTSYCDNKDRWWLDPWFIVWNFHFFSVVNVRRTQLSFRLKMVGVRCCEHKCSIVAWAWKEHIGHSTIQVRFTAISLVVVCCLLSNPLATPILSFGRQKIKIIQHIYDTIESTVKKKKKKTEIYCAYLQVECQKRVVIIIRPCTQFYLNFVFMVVSDTVTRPTMNGYITSPWLRSRATHEYRMKWKLGVGEFVCSISWTNGSSASFNGTQ